MNIDRRRLLLGLAAASTASAAIVAASSATETDPVRPENLALTRLGDALPAVAQEMADAAEDKQDRIDKWFWKLPRAPEAIAKDYEDHYSWERSLRGYPILPDGTPYRTPEGNAHREPHPTPLSVEKAETYAFRIKRLDADMKRKRTRYPLTPDQLMTMEAERAAVADKLAIATTYEAARERYMTRSGYEAALAREEAAADALGSLVGSIMAERAETMMGVIIQAEALAAWGTAPAYRRLLACAAKTDWPQQFATSVLRIAGR